MPSRADHWQKLGVTESNYRMIRPNWLEDLAAFVSAHSWLFFIAACVFIFIEAKAPGFGLPGILGLVCFGLVLFGNYLAGLAEMQEILLVLLGLGLIAIELFVMPGTLIPGVIGALAVLVGIFLSFQDFLIPTTALDRQVLENNLLQLTLSLVASITTILVITRYLPRTPVLRWLVLSNDRRPEELRGSGTAVDDLERTRPILVGAEGLSESDLRPSGKITLGERVIDAVAEGTFVERGQRIRVVKVEGNRIVVRPLRG
jgi:membrane-bound serine protease (ClpP class)